MIKKKHWNNRSLIYPENNSYDPSISGEEGWKGEESVAEMFSWLEILNWIH